MSMGAGISMGAGGVVASRTCLVVYSAATHLVSMCRGPGSNPDNPVVIVHGPRIVMMLRGGPVSCLCTSACVHGKCLEVIHIGSNCELWVRCNRGEVLPPVAGAPTKVNEQAWCGWSTAVVFASAAAQWHSWQSFVTTTP